MTNLDQMDQVVLEVVDQEELASRLMAYLGRHYPQALLERFLALPPEETLPDQWQAQIFARILSHHPVVFISDVPDKVVEAFHMTPAHSIQEALSKADRLLGRNDGRIVVIPEGISNIIR